MNTRPMHCLANSRTKVLLLNMKVLYPFPENLFAHKNGGKGNFWLFYETPTLKCVRRRQLQITHLKIIHYLLFFPMTFRDQIFILVEFAVSLLTPHPLGISTHATSSFVSYIRTICLLSLFLMVSNNLIFTIKLNLTLSLIYIKI